EWVLCLILVAELNGKVRTCSSEGPSALPTPFKNELQSKPWHRLSCFVLKNLIIRCAIVFLEVHRFS
ncbi:MAG: hypothetical protein WCE93_12460, partial [Nitrososphaeraceae archaeon]